MLRLSGVDFIFPWSCVEFSIPDYVFPGGKMTGK